MEGGRESKQNEKWNKMNDVEEQDGRWRGYKVEWEIKENKE